MDEVDKQDFILAVALIAAVLGLVKGHYLELQRQTIIREAEVVRVSGESAFSDKGSEVKEESAKDSFSPLLTE